MIKCAPIRGAWVRCAKPPRKFASDGAFVWSRSESGQVHHYQGCLGSRCKSSQKGCIRWGLYEVKVEGSAFGNPLIRPAAAFFSTPDQGFGEEVAVSRDVFSVVFCACVCLCVFVRFLVHSNFWFLMCCGEDVYAAWKTTTGWANLHSNSDKGV